uniref:Transmembrane protein n=1 Tax=Pithovirus LCPAC103 TaxID=2506588 RepID=A0A481Z374_9VIRU|nr:MAG: hypothetical protein LCPAC103_00040 [Pithovirus LCPAC103]
MYRHKIRPKQLYQATNSSKFKLFEIRDVLDFLDDFQDEEPTTAKSESSNDTTVPVRRSTSESAFISLLFAIIISWILVALWTRTVENFTFGTLGLDGDSTVHSLIVAVAASIIFFMLVWTLDQYDVIIGGIERVIEAESLIPPP